MVQVPTKVDTRSAETDWTIVNPATEETLAKIPGMSIPIHDFIDVTYTGTNPTTVVYKTGGTGGTTVATLTITYDGNDNPLTVTKS